jgi:uncharacterized protein
MKISGSYVLPFPPERAYQILQEPDVLAQCLPGVDALSKIGENEYSMEMKMAIASFSGVFQGKVKVTDPKPVSSYKMTVEGNSKIGFVKGSGDLQFLPDAAGCQVVYDGDVQVGGMFASIASRLIPSTSKMVIKQFFEKVVAVGNAAK